MVVPERCAVVLLFAMVAACEPAEEDSISVGDADTSAEAPSSAVELGIDVAPQIPNPTPHDADVPSQVTVLDEDKFDPDDPDVLHVPVLDGKETWVFDGAKQLVEQSGGDPKDLAKVVAAQALMARVADADVVARVTVIDISKQETGLERVTFEVGELIHGVTSSKQWSSSYDPNSVCGPRPPALGSQWLAFATASGERSFLKREGGLLALDGADDIAVEGLEATVSALAEVVSTLEEAP